MFEKLFGLVKGNGKSSVSHEIPVILCFVICKGEILLLRRGYNVEFYRGWWSAVTGYWDKKVPVEVKVKEKMQQELGVPAAEGIKSITIGTPYTFYDFVIEREWCMHPVLVEVDEKPWIYLNSQHQTSRWVRPEDVKLYDVIPRISEALEQFDLLKC